MLRLVWKAEHAGAPNDDRFANAVDRLYVREGDANAPDPDDREIQKFAKRDDTASEPSAALDTRIGDWLDESGTQRVVILVHGYCFDPDDNDKAAFDDDPYAGVFADTDALTSWLPIVGADIAVGFAWSSAPSFSDAARACWTNPYEYAVQDVSVQAARALATVIRAFRARNVTVDLFAHSLGTRVSIKALNYLADIGDAVLAPRRAVLLGGAEYSMDALKTSARLSTDCFNFVIREDGVLEWGAAQLGGKQRLPNSMASRVIGYDGVKRTKNWIDFQLDHADRSSAAEFRRWFDNLGGYKLSGKPTNGRGTHWAYYLHLDNRALYRDILANEAMTVEWMRNNGAPDGVERFRYQELKGKPPTTPDTCAGRERLYRRDVV